jgi:DNA-binding transcriptional regulator YhcF (GntR family)
MTNLALTGEGGSGLIARLLPFIAHRRLVAGDRLPSERDLAARFGASRPAIREALAVLEALRVVERRPNSGIFLRSVERQGSIEAMVLQAELGVPLSEAEVREVVELRRIMEMQAVRLAAERRSDLDLARIEATLTEGARCVASARTLPMRTPPFTCRWSRRPGTASSCAWSTPSTSCRGSAAAPTSPMAAAPRRRMPSTRRCATRWPRATPTARRRRWAATCAASKAIG